MDNNQTDPRRSLVIGGTGLVGGYIVEHLLRRGQRPIAMSRSPHSKAEIDWTFGDLRKPDELELPPFATLYCTADATLLASALPHLLARSPARVVAFSSTSVITKQDTEIVAEREMIRRLTEAEQKIAATCEQHKVG